MSAFDRQTTLGLLARATLDELQQAARALAAGLALRDLRPPEVGLIMLRGRIGGDGPPFNIGEATMSRAVIALEDGTIGHGHTLGRAPEKARLIALMDALHQGEKRQALEDSLLVPLKRRLAAEKAQARAETAATRVDFFTLVRGEDA